MILYTYSNILTLIFYIICKRWSEKLSTIEDDLDAGDDEIDENDFSIDVLLADASESYSSRTTNTDVSERSNSNEINKVESLKQTDRLGNF